MPGFGVTKAGTRFVTIRPADRKGSAPSLTLVQNWFSEFAKDTKTK